MIYAHLIKLIIAYIYIFFINLINISKTGDNHVPDVWAARRRYQRLDGRHIFRYMAEVHAHQEDGQPVDGAGRASRHGVDREPELRPGRQ